MTRADKQFNVRLSESVLMRLKYHAAENNKSVTALVNQLLETSVPELPDEVVKTQVRLPASLHNRLKIACKISGRSMNSEMVSRLETTFV